MILRCACATNVKCLQAFVAGTFNLLAENQHLTKCKKRHMILKILLRIYLLPYILVYIHCVIRINIYFLLYTNLIIPCPCYIPDPLSRLVSSFFKTFKNRTTNPDAVNIGTWNSKCMGGGPISYPLC